MRPLSLRKRKDARYFFEEFQTFRSQHPLFDLFTVTFIVRRGTFLTSTNIIFLTLPQSNNKSDAIELI